MANGSTLPRRALGRQLRKHREKAGLTQTAASRVAEISPQSYGRIEDGRQTKVMDLGLNALANAFGASDDERRLWLDLSREIRATTVSGGGWWRAYADAIATGFDHYLALEEAANWVTSWQTTMIPGLLQTREYRRAVEWSLSPESPTEDVERKLDVATRRQILLDKPDFRFEAVLYEAVIRHQVGGPAVMAEQLQSLLERSEVPGVEIRIVPFTEANPIGLLAKSFVILSFPELPTSRLREPPVAYTELLTGDLYMERGAELDRYSREAERIRHVAWSESASRDLVLRAQKEMK